MTVGMWSPVTSGPCGRREQNQGNVLFMPHSIAAVKDLVAYNSALIFHPLRPSR